MARENVRYKIAAKDTTEQAVKSAQGNLSKLGKSIGSVKVGLGAMAGAAGAAFAAFKIGSLVTGAIDAGDRIQKLSIQLGTSTEFLSEMSHVAALGGSNLEAVATASVKLSRSAVEAADGTKSYADNFAKLGIEAESFIKLSPEDQFSVMADALMDVENASERVAIAQDLMGRSGKDMLTVMAGGSAAMDRQRKEAESLGLSLSKTAADDMAAANDAMERMGSIGTALGTQLATHLAPVIVSVGEFVMEMIPAIREFAESITIKLGPALDAIMPIARRLIDIFNAVVRAAAGVAAAVALAASGEFSAAGNAIGAVVDDAFGTFATGGTVPKSGRFMLEQGERVVSNNTTVEGGITINATGGGPMSMSSAELRRWVRGTLMPELTAATSGGRGLR